jgi:hypothetical protein
MRSPLAVLLRGSEYQEAPPHCCLENAGVATGIAVATKARIAIPETVRFIEIPLKPCRSRTYGDESGSEATAQAPVGHVWSRSETRIAAASPFGVRFRRRNSGQFRPVQPSRDRRFCAGQPLTISSEYRPPQTGRHAASESPFAGSMRLGYFISI